MLTCAADLRVGLAAGDPLQVDRDEALGVGVGPVAVVHGLARLLDNEVGVLGDPVAVLAEVSVARSGKEICCDASSSWM